MKRLKTKILAAVCCVALLLVGCSKDQGSEYMSVGNVGFNEYEMYYNIYNTIGQQLYGLIDYDEAADIETVKEQINELRNSEEAGVKDYVESQIVLFATQNVKNQQLLKYATDNNITLSDEEVAAANESYQGIADFFEDEETLETIKTQKFFDSENPDQEAKDYLEKYETAVLHSYGATSFKQLQDVLEERELINKVLELKSDEVADDEAIIKLYYDELLASQQTSFAEDVAAFDETYNAGSPIVYYPEGLRYVKHILIEFNEEDSAKAEELRLEISELEANTERSEEDNATLTAKQTEYTDLNAKMDAEAKAQADDIYAKLEAGDDYDTLLEQHGDDEGMKSDSASYDPNGYLISTETAFVPEFLSVAFELKNVGDYSKPFMSDYGYHIVKYTQEVESRVVPFEEIRDVIVTLAMEEERNAYAFDFYNAAYEEGKNNFDVVINYDVLGLTQERFDELYTTIQENYE